MDDYRVRCVAEAVAVAAYPRLKLERTISTSPQVIQVWTVDGEHIRTYMDEEFTNFGQHYRFPFIPEFEFWIDKEGSCDELGYFVEHLKVEWGLMRDGKSYSEAIIEADRVERDLRRKDGDIKRLIDPVRRVVDPKLVRKKLLKTLENGVKVWLVNGCLVRSVFNIDFTHGGHEYVYEFVPPIDVLIDDDLSWEERGLVILHELHERNQMEKGMPYSKAHAESSALELHCRHSPDELHDALSVEGWSA